MNKATRKAIIAGNWKMNMTPSEAAAAVKKTAELVAGKEIGRASCRERV